MIYHDKVRDLSRNSGFAVRVQAEIKVISSLEKEKKKTRDIDILIEIFEGEQQSLPMFAFCIENKIKDGAIVKGDKQLYEEVVGLQNYYQEPLSIEIQPTLSLIFLTPETKHAAAEFVECLYTFKEEKIEISSLHMVWDSEENADSVASLLRNILDQEAKGMMDPIYDYTKHTIKSFLSFIYSGFQSYKEEKLQTYEKNDYGKPVISYITDYYHTVSFHEDILHDDLKKWVQNKIKEVSGLTIKNGNFDGSYIVNERNRKHYGINSPLKQEKNLFYYPDENNKKVIRKLDRSHLPPHIFIYWKDSEQPDSLGNALLTAIYN